MAASSEAPAPVPDQQDNDMPAHRCDDSAYDHKETSLLTPVFPFFFDLPTVTKKFEQAAPPWQGGTTSRKRACVLIPRRPPCRALPKGRRLQAMTAACFSVSVTVGCGSCLAARAAFPGDAEGE